MGKKIFQKNITLFLNKITNYHKQKLDLECKAKKSSNEEFPQEYSKLTKAKKDILDPIHDILNAAILFAKITEWADSPKPSDYLPKLNGNISALIKAKFPLKFRNNKQVLEKLEEDHQDYVREVFSEGVVRDIISSIFYGNYHTQIDDFHKEYRIEVAKLMIGFAATELKKYIDPQYRQFLEGDIDKAVGLCKSVNINPI